MRQGRWVVVRAMAGRAGAALAVAVAVGLAAWSSPSEAATGPGENAGRVVVVDTDGRPLREGDGDTAFTLELPDGAACQGDSVGEDYRVQSFLVPASDDPATLVYQGLRPQVDGGWALYRVDSATYVNQATDLAPEPGGEGTIINVPDFSFAVFDPGMLPTGRVHVGIACSRFTRTTRYWSTDLEVTAAEGVTAGVRWRVVDPPEGGGDGSAALPAGLAAVAVVAGGTAWRVRRARHARAGGVS